MPLQAMLLVLIVVFCTEVTSCWPSPV